MIAKKLPIALDLSEEGNKVISKIMKGDISPRRQLIELSRIFKVRVKFNKPVKIKQIPRKEKIDENSWRYIYYKITDNHVFSGEFFPKYGNIYYTLKRNGRRGYPCDWIDQIKSFEPVIKSPKNKDFSSFEQFKKKFDPLFTSDDQVWRLWNSKSAQHGGRYRPSDFHKLGKRGKEVLTRFMKTFKGVPGTPDTPCYQEMKGLGDRTIHYLSERYYSYHHSGRDITISHTLGHEVVTYSSEFHNCGNGRYGLIVNKNEFLWMEDD